MLGRASLAGHADIVALSFVSSASDLEALQTHLSKLRMRPPSIVLKIETRRGFEQLPDILMAAMKLPCAGIMIARGDLAVECGFERLAEVQEEIRWRRRFLNQGEGGASPAMPRPFIRNIADVVLTQLFGFAEIPIIALPHEAALLGILGLRRRLPHVIGVEQRK